MTSLGINMTDTDQTFDWTGLTSGHPRPLPVEQAYQRELDAWHAYDDVVDAYYERGVGDEAAMTAARTRALQLRQDYNNICAIWQASMAECDCRPIDPERDYTCQACAARNLLASLADDSMPY